MNIGAGTIIKSTAALSDPVFAGAVILITESNADGATGFIINKPFARKLNELQEYSHVRSFPLYKGGPVDQEHLFFVHQRPDIIEAGVPVCDSVFLGGNFAQAVNAINNLSLTERDIKIFIGYCGWNCAELEEEVGEGSWEMPGFHLQSVFQ